MKKKFIACEWLYFLLFVPLFGVLILPFLLMNIFGDENVSLSNFYSSLIGNEDAFWVAWLIVLFPYIVFQLIRSIIWALKQMK